jgi:two-component system, NarL family, nitrate/nitrite response regulator NarL
MSETTQKTIQILLVDDHALFREAVARLLGADPSFEVAGDCGSIDEGLDVLRQKSIDIVLLDFYLGDRNGKEFLRLARLHGFAGKVLLVTAGIDKANATDLIRAGISGIFLKRDSPSLLVQVVRHVVGGGVWFKQEELQSAVAAQSQTSPQSQNERFTEREQQVLSYVLEGFTNPRIAERIGVSTGSIKSTMQQLFSKTGVRTRSQLVRIVLEQYKDRL